MLQYAAGLAMFDHLLGYSTNGLVFPHPFPLPPPPPRNMSLNHDQIQISRLSPGSFLAFQCCTKH